MALATASAPGKVLICGGYLIVESPNVGLSLGVTARFRTSVISATPKDAGAPTTIEVRSPQFGATFKFDVEVDTAGNVTVQQSEGRESPFLYYGTLTTMAFVANFGAVEPKHLVVVLEADNDFYSQRNYLEGQGKSVTAANLRTVPPCNALVGEVSKTGLGSSAALTTSFVACLFHYYAKQLAASRPELSNVELVHRVAQTAHSVAQGKIGSGFDVHTAVYGTNVYVRFPPSRVDALMADKQPRTFNSTKVWDCVRTDVEWVPQRPVVLEGLPRGVNLMLADIHQGGSATPGMVAKIMGWRKSVAGDKDNAWDLLAAANVAFLDTLQRLCAVSEQSKDEYDVAIQSLRTLPCQQWPTEGAVVSLFNEFRGRAFETRRLLRLVGELSEVEVEPKVLTPLLDATAALPGVIAAGCPGAGGYDAIFAIVVGGNEEMSRVEAFWESSPGGLHVCPLLVREESRGLAVA